MTDDEMRAEVERLRTRARNGWYLQPQEAEPLITWALERDKAARRAKKKKAEAWDKGFVEGVIDQERWHVTGDSTRPPVHNPFRSTLTEEKTDD